MDKPEEYFEQYLEGSLSPEDKQTLEDWLRASPENRTCFYKATCFDSTLSALVRGDEIREHVRSGISRELGLESTEPSAIVAGVARALDAKPASRRIRSGGKRGRKTWRRAAGWAIAACILISIVFLVAEFDEKSVGRILAQVESFDSEIHIERGDPDNTKARLNDVYEGDTVITPADGTALLFYSGEHTTLSLKPDTRIIIGENGGAKRFQIVRGGVECTVAPQKKPMRLITPQAEVAVLGTRFTVQIRPASQDAAASTAVRVLRGKVQVVRIKDKARIFLTENQSAIAAADTELAVLTVKTAGPNILANGDFEKADKHIFTDWAQHDLPGQHLFCDTDIKHSGTQSIRLGPFPAPGENKVRLIKDEIQLKAFTDYHLSFWVKTAGLKVKWDNVGVKIGNRGGYFVDSIARMGRTFSSDQDWTLYNFAFKTGADPKVFVLVGVWGGEEGMAWFDDVTLHEEQHSVSP